MSELERLLQCELELYTIEGYANTHVTGINSSKYLRDGHLFDQIE